MYIHIYTYIYRIYVHTCRYTHIGEQGAGDARGAGRERGRTAGSPVRVYLYVCVYIHTLTGRERGRTADVPGQDDHCRASSLARPWR